jgi:uncharacterized Zn finger protein
MPHQRSDVDYYYGFKPYVPVGVRRARAAREILGLTKTGRTTSPVVIDGRKIARTFWGEAWCNNLEQYSDFSNRLPRGRTYVRNGSVFDLQITPGRVAALVSGSDTYEVQVTVTPLARARWSAICRDCSGAIDSLVELLQGRFSTGVMTRLCEQKTGLFPSPMEISFTCSCPDWAYMCKHVAAVLYGIGARLDHQPELLFTLRHVDQQELVAKAGSGLTTRKRATGANTVPSSRVLADQDLAKMFDIEIAEILPAERPKRRSTSRKRSAAEQSTGAAAARRMQKVATDFPRPAPGTSAEKKRRAGRRVQKPPRNG